MSDLMEKAQARIGRVAGIFTSWGFVEDTGSSSSISRGFSVPASSQRVEISLEPKLERDNSGDEPALVDIEYRLTISRYVSGQNKDGFPAVARFQSVFLESDEDLPPPVPHPVLIEAHPPMRHTLEQYVHYLILDLMKAEEGYLLNAREQLNGFSRLLPLLNEHIHGPVDSPKGFRLRTIDDIIQDPYGLSLRRADSYPAQGSPERQASRDDPKPKRHYRIRRYIRAQNGPSAE